MGKEKLNPRQMKMEERRGNQWKTRDGEKEPMQRRAGDDGGESAER